MDKMNKLILCFIPSNLCNLRCDYCVVSQVNDWERKDTDFKYPVEYIVKALSRERLGGTCYVNLTSQGETLLYKDILQLTKGLLNEGHYVEIVTNGIVTKRLVEILSLPDDLLGRLFFKISYHYQELERRGWSKRFWDNVDMIRESPCSFTLELMPHDGIADDIDNICVQCKCHAGAICHATVGRDDRKPGKSLLTSMSKTRYESTWSALDSAMFRLKMKLFGVKRREFCYAGAWSLLVDIASGEASQCYGRPNTQNIFEDLDKPIVFRPVGYSCMQPFCFNGHAHIAWGIIPELDAPTYYEVRSRYCDDGSCWVKSPCSELFHQKLVDNNSEYSRAKKIRHTLTNPIYLATTLLHDTEGLKRKVRKFYRIVTGKFEHDSSR